MSGIANLEVSLDLDNNSFTTKINRAAADTQRFGETVERNTAPIKKMERDVDTLSNTISSLRDIMVGLAGFNIAKDAFMGLVDAQKGMQQIQFGLQGALGSAQAAGAAYNYVSEVSARLGLNLRTAAQEFTKLTAAATAMNVPMSEQKKLFEGLSRSATVLHLSSDQVKFATMALSQMFGKGKIQAEELRRQLGEHIPGVVPRFMKAVAEMNKGTDLQNKSFDELLMMGALATDKYLPALTQALMETGAGAEHAAQGLNANINRLSTAWFKFKADATEGLFTDVVSGGARMLADNMQLVANTTMAAALAFVALKGAQFAGGNLSSIQSRATSAMQARRDAVDAAAANLAEQKSLQAKTAARIADLKAQQAAVAAARTELAQTAALAKADRLQAEETLRVAAARGAKYGVTRNSVVVEGQLTSAMMRQGIASRELSALQARELAIKQALTAANAELTVATNGVTAAQGRQAALGFVPSLTNGLKAAGSGLMALAGGPWGVALLAVTGLAMAAFSWYENASKADAEWKAHIETMRNISIVADDVIKSLNNMGAAADMGAAVDSWYSLNKGVADNGREIDELTKKLIRYKSEQVSVSVGGGGTMGMMGGNAAFRDRTADIANTEKKLAELRAQTAEYQAQLQEMEPHLKKALAPELYDLIVRKARELNAEDFQKFRDSLDLTAQRALALAESTYSALAKIQSSFGDKMWDMQVQAVRAGKDGQYRAELASLAKSYMDAFGVKNFQGAWAKMTPDQKVLFEQQRQSLRENVNLLEANRAAKKADTAATKEQNEAEKQRANTLQSIRDRIERQTAANQEFLDTSEKMTATERLVFKLNQDFTKVKDQLNAAQREEIANLIEKLKLQGEEVASKEKMIDAEKRLAQLTEQLNAARIGYEQGYQDELLGVGRGDKSIEQARAELAIQREYQRQLRDLGKQNLDPDSKSYMDQRAKIETEYQWHLARERQHQSQMETVRGSWMNGITSAWENFRDQANDVAGNVKTAMANTMNGLTDAVTNFVMTGKMGFREFATNAIKEFTRILVSKALAKLAEFVIGMFGGSTSAAAPATGSANGNIMTTAGPAKLNKYEKGGIARSPQLSVFGEGRLPEAYVPLPDGRSIPVTMQGNVGGGASNNSVQVNVTVHSDGSATEENKDATNQQAKQLGQLMSERIKEVLVTEQRQGGILWKMKHG